MGTSGLFTLDLCCNLQWHLNRYFSSWIEETSGITTVYIQMELCGEQTLQTAIDKGLYLEMPRVWRMFRVRGVMAAVVVMCIYHLRAGDRRGPRPHPQSRRDPRGPAPQQHLPGRGGSHQDWGLWALLQLHNRQVRARLKIDHSGISAENHRLIN